MWTLLKAARKAYKAWKAMDPHHREALADEAHRVRALAVELAGPAAARFVDGSADAAGGTADADGAVPEEPGSGRPKATVTAELREAVEALTRACVAPGAKVFNESAPRSARLGARMAKAGARRVVPRIQERTRTPADTGELAPPAESLAPGWYADPSGEFDHRYWDGRHWTNHVSRNGITEIDPDGSRTESSNPAVE